MSRERPSLITRRGKLVRTDPSITLTDVCDAFTADAPCRALMVSRTAAARCINERADIRDAVVAYATTHGFSTEDPRELLAIYTQQRKAPPTCKACGKPTAFNRQLLQYATYCSLKCQNNDPGVKERHKQTNLSIYGVDNAAKNKDVIAKQVSTTVARYGASCYLATDAGKAASKATCLQRYGVTNTGSVPELKQKRRETMLKKYGAPHAFLVPGLLQKARSTCIERYGNEFPGTWKLLELGTEQRGARYDGLAELLPDYEIQCTRDEFRGLKDFDNKWRCKRCGEIFTHKGIPLCRCQKRHAMQNALCDALKPLYPDIVSDDRNTLKPLELDLYIPSKRVGIEFNGVYWHSELFHDSKYHLAKTVTAAGKGVRLIHIFEDEWLLTRDLVIAKVKAILGERGIPINARACSVVSLTRDAADGFLSVNHIQGQSNSSSVRLGLVHNATLVAVCTFSHIWGCTNGWYLDRYATLRGYSVRGGCGKLLAAFERTHNPKLVRTFADRRWSVGGMYRELGFTCSKIAPPAYWYVLTRVSTPVRKHRFCLRKDKLVSELGGDANLFKLTERELAAMAGYLRIWDCGQLVYEKHYK